MKFHDDPNVQALIEAAFNVDDRFRDRHFLGQLDTQEEIAYEALSEALTPFTPEITNAPKNPPPAGGGR